MMAIRKAEYLKKTKKRVCGYKRISNIEVYGSHDCDTHNIVIQVSKQCVSL